MGEYPVAGPMDSAQGGEHERCEVTFDRLRISHRRETDSVSSIALDRIGREYYSGEERYGGHVYSGHVVQDGTEEQS